MVKTYPFTSALDGSELVAVVHTTVMASACTRVALGRMNSPTLIVQDWISPSGVRFTTYHLRGKLDQCIIRGES